MMKTRRLFLATPVLLFMLILVQPVAAQEWKSLSDENGLGSPSIQSLFKLPDWVKREASGLNQPKVTKEPPPHYTGRDILRLDNDRRHEYAREGSWAPLETKPGEENFQLFTF